VGRRAPRRPWKFPFSTTIEPTKDMSLCSIKVASESAAMLAQKLNQLQPFISVFPRECTGQLASSGKDEMLCTTVYGFVQLCR
jgi:hypothetical protein